jgi:hypothetical protein
MSEPTIWDIAMGGKPPEKFVPYEDYARLKAQVERLTKAGDALAEAVGDPTVDWPPREAAWHAAKEGKQL